MIRKVRRLFTMRPSELLWRARHTYIVQQERVAFNLGLYEWPERVWKRRICRNIRDDPAPDKLAEWWQHHMRSRHEPAFLLDSQELVKSALLYPSLFPGRLDSLFETADRICLGKFSFLGIDLQTGSEIKWKQDPITRRDWPGMFYANLNVPFCEGTDPVETPGDSKHVWELNRHEFLVDCAKAYYLSGNDKYAERVIQLVTHWVSANPYLEGINWAGPLEVALRSMAWLWAYQFCRTWKNMSADDLYSWIKSFYQHGHYLNRHLEVYSSPNNHLVGEATALYLLGSFFPEFDDSEIWRAHAWQILAIQPRRQFYPDGEAPSRRHPTITIASVSSYLRCSLACGNNSQSPLV